MHCLVEHSFALPNIEDLDKYDDSQQIATEYKHDTNKGIGLEHDREYYATKNK